MKHAAVTAAEVAAGVVVMMCGVAGSGKTTVAQRLGRQGLVRLSIDEEIWRQFGRYGVDYPPARYGELQALARTSLDVELEALLAAGTPVVLDYSFWRRQDRDRYKAAIERHGRPWRLLVLRVHPDVLRARLAERGRRFDADAAFPITDELLASYLDGFEWPSGEGETEIAAW